MQHCARQEAPGRTRNGMASSTNIQKRGTVLMASMVLFTVPSGDPKGGREDKETGRDTGPSSASGVLGTVLFSVMITASPHREGDNMSDPRVRSHYSPPLRDRRRG